MDPTPPPRRVRPFAPAFAFAFACALALACACVGAACGGTTTREPVATSTSGTCGCCGHIVDIGPGETCGAVCVDYCVDASADDASADAGLH